MLITTWGICGRFHKPCIYCFLLRAEPSFPFRYINNSFRIPLTVGAMIYFLIPMRAYIAFYPAIRRNISASGINIALRLFHDRRKPIRIIRDGRIRRIRCECWQRCEGRGHGRRMRVRRNRRNRWCWRLTHQDHDHRFDIVW